jgi:hypothetical protein
MKWFFGMLLMAVASAALGSPPPPPPPPMTGGEREAAPLNAAVESFVRMDRPPAPEVWVITVKQRTRPKPQSEWGEWSTVKTIPVKGTYHDALKKAEKAAREIDKKGKNYQGGYDIDGPR